MQWRSVMLACGAALVAAGCSGPAAERPQIDQSAVESYLADKPEATHSMFRRVVAEGERNRVLNLLRAGLGALQLGHDQVAAAAFDAALVTIETVYGGDETAARARSTFTAEDRKVFRGEPYERAMAFYYRGILYLLEEDYENARASFRSGMLQDTLAEQAEYRQDFALLEFLDGWSSQCNGDLAPAAEAYGLARRHNESLVLPGAADNILVLADIGHAPVKFASGEHGQLLRIRPNDARFDPIEEFRFGARPARLPNRESILWQAQSRGGRQFDAILEGKAQFKEGAEQVAETAGSVAEVGVAVGTTSLLTGNEDMASVGGTMALAGGLMSLVAGTTADATRPEADTRQWDNLPEFVQFGTFSVAGGLGEIDMPGRVLRGGGSRCQVAWTRLPAFDPAAAVLHVAGKTFIGTADTGEDGVHPYSIAFHASGAAKVEWGDGGLFCMSCASMAGTWTEEAGAVQVRWSEWPIDATIRLRRNGDRLEGEAVHYNVYGRRTTGRATLRLQEHRPEG